jgi:hypothetical protein
MGKHNDPQPAPTEHQLTRTDVRRVVLVMAAMTVFVVAMIASYSGAFAKPTLHHLDVAVSGPDQLVTAMQEQDALDVTRVADAAAARAQVTERRTDAAMAVTPTGELEVFVAGGGGRSVANAAESVGRGVAAKAGLTPVVTDVAPTSAADPQGTVEFYAVIFLSIGASLGATVFGFLVGRVTHLATLARRTLSLVAYSAVLAGAVTVYVDAALGALTGHTWQVFGALWLYALAVSGAVTGVSAAFGTIASASLTIFLVIVGNAAAAGPVGLPLLSGFYTTLNGIVPQGSGVALLRSIEYFDGHGAVTPLVTLVIWAATGAVLALGAVLAPAAARAYRAHHDQRDGAVLRPGVLSPAD